MIISPNFYCYSLFAMTIFQALHFGSSEKALTSCFRKVFEATMPGKSTSTSTSAGVVLIYYLDMADHPYIVTLPSFFRLTTVFPL